MALRYYLATYDPDTYLVGDEIVSGTPTFVHTSTIYQKGSDEYYYPFGENKRVVKYGNYVSEDHIYAVETTQFNKSVISNTDDAEENLSTGNVVTSSSDLELGNDGGNRQMVGVRFQNITIPKDATIFNAYIEFTARGSNSTTCNLYIDAEAADNPSTYIAGTRDSLSDKTITGNAVDWLGVETWTDSKKHRSVDISSLVTATVSRTNWSSGNAISFMITGDSGHTRNAYSADNSFADSEPKLFIEYTTSIVLLDPRPFQHYQPAASNANRYSRDVDHSNWNISSITFAFDAIGLDKVVDASMTLTATAANATAIVDSYTAASNTHSVKWYLKRDSGTGTVELTVDGGTTWQAITLTSAYQSFSIDQASVTNPENGIRIGTSGDSVILGNAELHINRAKEGLDDIGPIFVRSTYPVATDEIINTYPAANWSNSEGPIYLVHDYKGVDEDILLNDGVAILYVTSDVLYLDDGTNTTSIAYATEGEQEIAIALDETNGFMRLNVNGTWAD